MAITQVNPTRMELTRLKQKLATAIKGHKLLKDKRDELMRQFLEMVRENMRLRCRFEQDLKKANQRFALAGAMMNRAALHTALMYPKQSVHLEVSYQNVMGVEIPHFRYQTRTPDPHDINCYGYGFTSVDLDEAVQSLADAFPSMLELAEKEKACQLMALEIEKTRRRVNALEHVMIPEYQEKIRYITMKLDESERSTQIRLMKVKDMMVRQKIEKSHRERFAAEC